MSEAVAEALSATPEAAPAVVEAPEAFNEDDALGAAFDRLVTNNGSDRAQDGKFASPTKDKTASAEQASSGGEEGAGAGEAVPADADATPAPANWNGLEDAWKAIPAEQREKVKAHFDDLHRRMSDQGRQLASVKPIADHISQATKAIPLFQGMSPDQVSQKALELAAIAVDLKRDPVNTLIEVARNTGQLAALQAKLSGQAMPEGQKIISDLQAQIAGLERKLAQAADPSQIETHVSRVFEGRAAQEAVNQFASDPANSFFADVEPHLPDFIPIARKLAGEGASVKDVLKSAYDMAINAHPEIRTKAQAAAKNAAAEADAKRREDAKKAASVNVKSTSTGRERELTELEALNSAYDRAMAT